jgi:hypothetical protein
MASVNMPVKKDPMDQLAKGLQIAQSMFGIYSDYRGIKNMNAAEDAATAAKEDQANQVIDEKDKAALITKGGLELTSDPKEAQLAFNQKNKDGGLTPVYFKLPKEQAKTAAPRYQLATTQEGVFAINTANPDDKRRVGGRPMPARSEKSGLSLPKDVAGVSGADPNALPVIKGAEEKKRFDSIAMGYNGVNEMSKALQNGSNTFSFIGDNDYTMNLRNAAEAFGRLQSGGAINNDEEARFIAMAPKWNDSAEIQTKKLNNMRDEYVRRAATLGVNEDTMVAHIEGNRSSKQVGVAAPGAPSGTAMAAPAQISQEDALKELARRGIQPKR